MHMKVALPELFDAVLLLFYQGIFTIVFVSQKYPHKSSTAELGNIYSQKSKV